MPKTKKKIILFFPLLERGKEFHWPPISLLSLAAVLKKHSFNCLIIDERVEKNADSILKKELKGALCLGLTAFTGFSLGRSVRAAELCRKLYPKVPIIWGGPHVTALPEQSRHSPLVDDVVEGYGEFEFLEKVRQIAAGKSHSVSADKKDFRKQLMAPDMPSLPYDLIDIKKYINPRTQASIYLTSYGCPGQCTFCSTQTLRKWTPFAMEKVKKDLDNLFKAYPFKQIVFYDATFFVKIERALEIIGYLKRYKVEWIADARTYEAERFDHRIISFLEENGLKAITIGLETGAQHMVEVFNKGEGQIERMYKIAEKFKNSPISIISAIIFGSPGETISDLKETLKVLKELRAIKRNFYIGTTFFRPLPGTALYDVLERDYNYKFPQSLETWAKYGARSHYRYNEFMDTPWFDQKTIKEYKRIYTEFFKKNGSLLANGQEIMVLKQTKNRAN
jgi:radical SAM superfamily enzyme YgiQ (UPF0313 family)